jgi:acyl-CoA thioester hydrolase
MLETYRGVVYPSQEDHMGHMNVQWYTSKFDEGTWHLFSAVGLTSEYMRREKRGMAAVEQLTRYLAEVMAGNLLVVRTRILEVQRKTLRFQHHMFDAESGQEVANTTLTAVHLDRVARKSCLLPEAVVARCRQLLESDD